MTHRYKGYMSADNTLSLRQGETDNIHGPSI